MSQMIDGARDEFDALDPLESDRGGAGAAPRSRRGRRAVIVDESYGDEAFGDAEPDFAAADDDMLFEDDERDDRPRRGYEEPSKKKSKPLAIRSAPPAKAPRESGGAVWGWAFVAAMIWIGGVIGFSAGLLRLQLLPVSQFLASLSALDPQTKLIMLAIAVAPLGLIVQTALAARRSQRLAAETARLNRLIADLGGAPGRGAAAGGLREDAEEATRAFGALEEGFEAAEERMQLARSRFETERAALSKLVEDLDEDVARMTKSLTSLSGAASDATRAHAVEFAEMVAAAMARSGGAPTTGGDPLGDSPRERVQRMAEAAGRGAGSSAEPAARGFGAADFGGRGGLDEDMDVDDGDSDEATQKISALQRRLQGGLDDLGTAGDEDDGLGDGYDDAELAGAYDEDGYGDAGAGDEPPGFDEEGYDEPGFADEGYEAPAAAAAEDGLDWGKLVRAANFPDSEDDRETLDALYAVLTDHEAAALLQSAEDALSSLADFGLFMEDMQPRHAPVELWRAFIIDNARGDDVMDLGGVRDPHAIEDVATALHDKPEFEETAKRFLERYESVLQRLFREAPTPRMAVELADTRSGRAYMLIGRAFGRFG